MLFDLFQRMHVALFALSLERLPKLQPLAECVASKTDARSRILYKGFPLNPGDAGSDVYRCKLHRQLC